MGGDLNGGPFGMGGVYDPREFVLTARRHEVHLEVGVGLTRMEDPTGHVVTVTDGVTPTAARASLRPRPAGSGHRSPTPRATTRYAYDAAGDLVKVTDERGKAISMTYFPGHYLDTVKDPSGTPMTRYEYTDGRMTALIDGEGNRVAISSDPAARQETVTDPGGRRTTISTFDEQGQLVRTNEIYGGRDHVTTYAYDTDKHLVRREDPEGRVWSATYVKGNLATSDPDGDKVAVTWTDEGLPKTWTEPGGRITTYDWDIEGTLTSVTDPMGEVETYTYNGEGLRETHTDATGKTTSWTYNPRGLIAWTTDPAGGVTSYEYDATGRRTATIDALGHRSTVTYDADGEPVDASRCRRRGHALHLRRPGRRQSSGPAVGDGRGLHPRPDRARHAHRRPRRWRPTSPTTPWAGRRPRGRATRSRRSRRTTELGGSRRRPTRRVRSRPTPTTGPVEEPRPARRAASRPGPTRPPDR